MSVSNAGCSPPNPPAVSDQYTTLVNAIARGDSDGLVQLHNLMRRCARPYCGRKVGFADADDLVAEAFLAVVRAIQRGTIRQPECLMGFIATVVRRQIAVHVNAAARRGVPAPSHSGVPDRRPNIEDHVLQREKAELLAFVLGELSCRDREILSRFYLEGETKERVCAEMNLTPTQFRLLKSRAKARLTQKVQRRYARPQGWTVA